MAVWAFCIWNGVHRVGLHFLVWESEKILNTGEKKWRKKCTKEIFLPSMGEINMYKKRLRTMKYLMHLKQKCAIINYLQICCVLWEKNCTKVRDSVQKTCMLVKQGQNGWQPQAPILGEQMEDSGWLCVKENHVDHHVSHVGSFILDPLNIDCVPDVNTELESSKWRTQLILLKNKTAFDNTDNIRFMETPLNIWSLNYSSFSAMPPKLPQLKATSNSRSERALCAR